MRLLKNLTFRVLVAIAIGVTLGIVAPDTARTMRPLGDTFIERIWEIAQRYALPGAATGVKCVPAQLGDDSGIVGCAAYAKARFHQ